MSIIYTWRDKKLTTYSAKEPMVKLGRTSNQEYKFLKVLREMLVTLERESGKTKSFSVSPA